MPDGYATDNGTGLVFAGTELVDCVTEVDGARTWQMTRRPDGTVSEIPLPTRLLSWLTAGAPGRSAGREVHGDLAAEPEPA